MPHGEQETSLSSLCLHASLSASLHHNKSHNHPASDGTSDGGCVCCGGAAGGCSGASSRLTSGSEDSDSGKPIAAVFSFRRALGRLQRRQQGDEGVQTGLS